MPTREGTIRLGQFLKLADLVDRAPTPRRRGLPEVLVNGAVETRRGRQLVTGDIVTVGGRSARVGRATPAGVELVVSAL